MLDKSPDWSEILKKVPSWLMGFFGFVSAIVGFIKLYRGDTSLVTVALLVVGIGGGLAGCAYLAFKRTKPLLEGGRGTWQYPRCRPWAIVGLIVIPLLTIASVGTYFHQQSQSSDEIIILVADFDGPEPKKYRVTEILLSNLRRSVQPYKDVQVTALGRAITEAEGPEDARREGERYKADIVIWGWYGVTAETVPLSVHFEMLRSLDSWPGVCSMAQGEVQVIAISELERSTLQTQLSEEMNYLSLFTVGLIRYEAEDWDGAISSFTSALEQSPKHITAIEQSNVWFYRGSAYSRKGESSQALADYYRALKLNPDFAEVYFCRGVIYNDLGYCDAALDDYARALNIDPDHICAHNNRALIYSEMGNYDAAIADLTDALNADPEEWHLYYNRGQIYYDIGNYDAALTDCTRVIELNPDYALAYSNRGLAHHHMSNYDAAVADYTRALDLNPNDADAYYNRGLAYKELGKVDKAIADFERCLELTGDLECRQCAEQFLRELRGTQP